MNNIVKQPMLPDTIHFHHTTSNDSTEVMRITRTGVWVNPDLSIDDTAKAVLAALDSQIKVLVQAEREACAKVCDDHATKDDIIHMAREAGFNHPRLETETDYSRLERLVALARADEHASMMQLFTDPENQPTQHGTVTVEYMREQIAAEREACAQVCEELHLEGEDNTGLAADMIRARGNT